MKIWHLTSGLRECGIRRYTEEFSEAIGGDLVGSNEDWLACFEAANPDVAHCQFAGGLYNTSNLSQLRQRCQERRILFAVTFHNCLALIPPLQPDLLFVHTQSSFQEAVRLGFPEARIIHIPHGIPKIIRTQEPEPDLLGIFGFLLPHKGILESLEALHHLRHHPFRLFLQTPIHPPNREKSERLAKEMRERIHHLELADRVEFNTEFLDNETLISQLSRIDLFLFPYTSDAAQASSAAARTSMAYGRPAVVSQLPLFEGMMGVEYCAPGDTLSLSQAIQRMYEGDYRQKLIEAAQKGAEQDSWTKVAERTREAYESVPGAPVVIAGMVLGCSSAVGRPITPDRQPGQLFFRLRAGGRVPYSFSHVLCEWGKELVRQGHRVAIQNLALEHEREFNDPLSPAALVDWEINFTYPPRFVSSGPAHHYAEVCCWETTYYPESWANLASSLERILTLSDFSRQALIRSGIPNEKISVVPGGIDTEIFRPEGEGVDWGQYGMDAGVTVFFHMGALDSRKGTPELIRAYLRAFSQADNVLLFIKNNSFAGYYNLTKLIDEEICAQANRQASPPLIVHRSEDWPPQVLAAHMRGASFGVFPYKAEGGFGLISLELMGCGTSVIISDFGAPVEYAKPNCLLVGGKVIKSEFKSRHHIESHKSLWFEVDEDDLVEVLQLAHRMYQNEGKFSPQIVSDVAHQYTWKHSVQQLLKELQ